MRCLLLLLCFAFSTLLAQSQESLQSQLEADWKLINHADASYSYSGLGAASEIHNYRVSPDSVLEITYCYIYFSYKVERLDQDTLILRSLQHDTSQNLIFARTICTEDLNPFNNAGFLSFQPKQYRLLVDDNEGFRVRLLDPYYRPVALKESSAQDIASALFGNRFADTYTGLIIFETAEGRFGLINGAGKVCLAPAFKSLHIEYEKAEVKDQSRYSVPIRCTLFNGTINTVIHYY